MRFSLVPLGNFPVLLGFRGSSSVTSWSSCLVICFSPVLGISALEFYTPCLVCLWDLILCQYSCPLRRYAEAFCPFCLCLSLLISPCRCFGHELNSLLFSGNFLLLLPLFWGVHPFALWCLIGICSLVSGWACFLLLGFGAFVHCSSPGVIGVFFLALFLYGKTWFLYYFYLVWISGSCGGLPLGRVSVSVLL